MGNIFYISSCHCTSREALLYPAGTDSALNSQLASDNKALDAARQELLLWQDPEYIKSQARERLHFVLPGERQYIVTENGTASNTDEGTKVANSLTDGQPWYSRLIASITEAG